MIRTIIIEDEQLAANKLKRLLNKIDVEITVVKHLGSLSETISYLSTNPFNIDLIFLDIHLGDGNCFGIFEQVDIETPIIFTTAYNEYAIQAFQQNSVDYLLKPIDLEGLEKAISKFERYFKTPLKNQIDYKQLALYFQTTSSIERFIVYIGSKIRSISVTDVAYFFSEQGNTFLTTFEGKTYDINYTLEKLGSILDNQQYYRVNRKVIVHIEAIEEVYQFSKSKLKIELHPKAKFDIFVPLDKVVAFKKWLGM